MNQRQIRMMATVDRALGVAPPAGPGRARIVAAQRDLRAVRETITMLLERQAAPQARRGYTALKLQQLRNVLRIKHLFPVQKRARRLLKGLPGLAASLRVPHAKAKDEELIKAAQRIANAVRPHATQFVRVGFAKHFVQQLERAAAALATAANAPGDTVPRAACVPQDLEEAFRDARLALEALDAVVVAHFAPGSEDLKFWKRNKRLRGRIGRPRERDIARRKKPPTTPPPE